MAEVLTKIITETLSSGVEPLHRKYYGIYDGYGEVPIAYLTETEVFTAASGIVADYRNAIENTEVGRRFSLSCIASAIRAVRGLREVDRQVSFITAEVTGSFLSGNVLKDLDGLLDDVSGEKICLAFSEKTLTEGGEKVKGGIQDYASAKINIKLTQKQDDGSYGELLDVSEYFTVSFEGVESEDVTDNGTYYSVNIPTSNGYLVGNGAEIMLPLMHFTVKTGSAFESAGLTYSNYRVIVEAVLCNGSGGEIGASKVSNYVVYTNAKIDPNFLE